MYVFVTCLGEVGMGLSRPVCYVLFLGGGEITSGLPLIIFLST